MIIKCTRFEIEVSKQYFGNLLGAGIHMDYPVNLSYWHSGEIISIFKILLRNILQLWLQCCY